MYRVASLAIITTITREFSIVYILVGLLISFCVAYRKFNNDNGVGIRMGAALFYSITNLTILAKCPLGTRKENYPVMKALSVTWVILHSLSLVSMIIWVSLPTTYHLPHWANTQRLGLLSNLPVFYGICGALLILGPVTILTLASLKRQVKDMEEEGKRKLWEVDWSDVIGDDGCNKKPEKRVEMHIVHL